LRDFGGAGDLEVAGGFSCPELVGSQGPVRHLVRVKLSLAQHNQNCDDPNKSQAKDRLCSDVPSFFPWH
jgi:hypothetical protein